MSKYGLDTDDGQVNHGKARFIVFGVGGGGGNARRTHGARGH